MAKATGSSVPAGLEHWTRREIVEECRTALAAIGGWTLASIGVTSSLRGEGRSTIAAASALVERYTYCRRTVLVELDLESPSLAGTLGLQAGPGVVQVLSGKASLENCIQWADDDLGVLVAGHPGDGPSAPERSLPISQLMRSLDALCEAVIVDLPPLLPTGLPAELAAGCSSIVLVVRAGAAPLHDIRRAVAALDRPPPVILNRIGSKGPAWLDNMLGGRR